MPKFFTKEQITSIANQIKTYIDTKFGKAVLFTPQTLEDSEKAQARTNINTDKPSENKTASGDIASFTDGSSTPVKDLKATLDVVQPNPYDRPWPAGGGKNKFQVTAVTKAEGGVTFTINSDGSVKLSGSNTTTGNVTCILGVQELPAGTYTISSGVNGSASTVRLRVYNGDTATSYFYVDGAEVNLTLSETTNVALQIYVASGYAPTQIFYPMIRLATETDATFAPYENICPIYPVTEVEVSRTGKNFVNIGVINTTVNGLTFKSTGDGRVTITGTATATSNFNLATNIVVKAGGYSLCDNCTQIISTNPTDIRTQFYIPGPTPSIVTHNNYPSNAVVTGELPDGDSAILRFRYVSGVTYNCTISPVVAYGEYENGQLSFEPYQAQNYLVNIGINQWDEEWEVGSIDSNGQPTTGTSIRSKNFCSIMPSTQYYGKNGGSGGMTVYLYDANKAFITSKAATNAGFTTTADSAFFKLSLTNSYGATYNNDISINYPSRFTDYFPYTGNVVYGGELDVTTGVLTSRYAYVDLGSLTWTYESSETPKNMRASSPTTPVIGGRAFCSVYAEWNGTLATLPDKHILLSGTSSYPFIRIFDTSYTDAATFKTAMSGVQLVYELATPITIQLTPTEVQTLTGTNNLWADRGAVNVSYWTEGLIEADNLNAVLDSKKVVYASPHTYSKEEALQARLNIGAGSNRNLLDNPWFTVNQRSFESSTGVNAKYTVDRWQINNGVGGTVSLENGEIKLNANSGTSNISFQQAIDFDLTGKTVTMSLIDGNGTLYQRTATVTERTSSYVTVMECPLGSTAIYLRLLKTPSSLPYGYLFQITVAQGSSFTIKAVKLELGSVSTLVNDAPPNYQQELAKCQYYFNRIKVIGTSGYTPFVIGYASATNVVTALYPCEMRKITSVTFSGAMRAYRAANNESGVISAISVPSQSTHTITLSFTTSANYMTQGEVIFVQTYSDATAYIDISADL